MILGGERRVFTSTADPTTSRSRPRRAISSPPPSRRAPCAVDRGVPLALLANGANWVLVHARPNEPTTTATFDRPDLWLEERDLLRAFFSLLRAPFVAAGRLAELFAKSAAAQAEVADTVLGTQVRQAVELLVGELSRLNRESAGALLRGIEPRRDLPWRAGGGHDAPGVLLYAEDMDTAPGRLGALRGLLLGAARCTTSSSPSGTSGDQVGRACARRPGRACSPRLRCAARRFGETERSPYPPSATECSTRRVTRGWTRSRSPTW